MNNIFSALKKYVFYISLFILVIYELTFSYVNAENINDTDISHLLDYKSYINNYIESMNEKLKNIDDLILYMKSQKEYTKYPAVRLNVQTPFLGIAAMTENKLSINDNISIFDRTQSYSIRDVLNKKSIKIPSFSIGGITILTKDVNIYSTELTKEELMQVLNSLKLYDKKLDEVYLFVQEQKNNIFLDYIDKDIKQRIDEYRTDTIQIQKELLDNNDKLVLLHIISTSLNDDYTNIVTNYSKIYESSLKILDELSNILITKDGLDKIKENISNLKEELTKVNTEINLMYEVEILNLDVNKILSNINENVRFYILDIEDYIKNSYIEEELNDNATKSLIEKYEIKDKSILEELITFYDEINLKIKERENVEVEEFSKKVYTKDEDVLFIENVNKNYYALLNKVQKFYEDNLKYILNIDIKEVESIMKYTDINVSKYLQVIYFDLQSNINAFEKMSSDSIINTLNLINNYKSTRDTLMVYNEEIYSIYEEKLKTGEIES